MTRYSFVPWAELSSRRVVVTGASGLVGSAMVRMLLSRNDLAEGGIKVAAVEILCLRKFGSCCGRYLFGGR